MEGSVKQESPMSDIDKKKSQNLTEEQKKVWLATLLPHKKCTSNKPLLTKQAHHIASEQKRRENIRAEFDRIVQLTPALTEQENRSELSILTKSADYIDQLKDENKQLIELCRLKGIPIPEELIYKGPGVAHE